MTGVQGSPLPWGITPTVSSAWLEDALEKLYFSLLAVTESKESLCSSLELSSGQGQWSRF